LLHYGEIPMGSWPMGTHTGLVSLVGNFSRISEQVEQENNGELANADSAASVKLEVCDCDFSGFSLSWFVISMVIRVNSHN